MDPELHAGLAPLAFLLGTWRGAGTGEYPTIEPFAYEEEMTFEHAGDAWIAYLQRSWAPADGAAIHSERGFFRPGEGDAIELTLAHPLGLVEVAHGTLDGTRLELSTGLAGMGRTDSGMDVTAVLRRYEVEGDELRYELLMATERTPMTRHLQAVLRRDG